MANTIDNNFIKENVCQFKSLYPNCGQCEDKEMCAVRLMQKLIAGKWKLYILSILKNDTLRFGELHRRIPGISQGVLTNELRELEHTGLIHREVYKEVPPKVEYSLTEISRKFIPVLDSMNSWVKEYIVYIRENNSGEN